MDDRAGSRKVLPGRGRPAGLRDGLTQFSKARIYGDAYTVCQGGEPAGRVRTGPSRPRVSWTVGRL